MSSGASTRGVSEVKRVAVGFTRIAAAWSCGAVLSPRPRMGREAPEGCEPAPPARPVANGPRRRVGAKFAKSRRKVFAWRGVYAVFLARAVPIYSHINVLLSSLATVWRFGLYETSFMLIRVTNQQMEFRKI